MEAMTPQPELTAPDQESKGLYSGGQVALATTLSGPLAAGWMISRNYRELGDEDRASRAMLLGFAAMLIVVVAAMLAPTDLPSSMIPAIYGALAFATWKALQESAYTDFIASGGARTSHWRVAAVTLIALLVSVVVLFAALYTLPIQPLNHVRADSNVIYYEGDATAEDARRLGRFLVAEGIIAPDSQSEFVLEFPSAAPRLAVMKATIDVPPEPTEARAQLLAAIALIDEHFYGRDFELHVINDFGITTERLSAP